MYAIPGVSPEPPLPCREIPTLTLKPQQVAGLLDRLQNFWKRFAPFFSDESSGSGGSSISRAV